MSFIKKTARKTTVPALFSNATVTHINLKDRNIVNGNNIANFERLCYLNCPVLPIEGKRIKIPLKQTELVDANRKDLIINICNIINELDVANRTKINLFNELVAYFRFSDSIGSKIYFDIETVSLYIDLLIEKYHSGTKGKGLSVRQARLRMILKEIDPKVHEQCKDIFFKFPHDTENVQPYTDGEVKEIVYSLYAIYEDYSRHFKDETVPLIFPLYREKDSNGVSRLHRQHIFKPRRVTAYKTNSTVWKSDMSRVAYYLTCFYTGVNASPLLGMKLSDLTEEPFKGVTRKIYKLKTVKGRQGNKINNIDVGFSNKAKVFLESWIEISRELNLEQDGYLFPIVVNDKCSQMTTHTSTVINKYLLSLELPTLSSQKFRKTKASLIMRATESIFMVAQGLNNSVETAAKHYADGDPVTAEFSLASALYVRERTALGEPLEKVVKESSFLFKDPVREQAVGEKAKKLSNGLRCNGAFKEKSKRIKEALVKEGIATEIDAVACYKFLECFGCKHHAVVAEVQDVWLLLSFNDVILQAATRPSMNSKPSNLFNKVNNTLQLMLDKIKKEHAVVYNEAYDKYLDDSHPLWKDSEDLDLMLGVY